MLYLCMDFSPDQKDAADRLINNPGKIGSTTGKSKTINNVTLVQVKFSAAEIGWRPLDEIEKVDEELAQKDS